MQSVSSNAVAVAVGWQFIKSEVGSVDIPIIFNKYREILIIATPWINENAYNTSLIIPTHFLSNYNIDTINSYVMGYGGRLNTSTPYGGRVGVDIYSTLNKLKLTYSVYDNSDRTSVTRLTVYAR